MANAVAAKGQGTQGQTWQLKQANLIERRRRNFRTCRNLADSIIALRSDMGFTPSIDQFCQQLSSRAFELSRQWANK